MWLLLPYGGVAASQLIDRSTRRDAVARLGSSRVCGMALLAFVALQAQYAWHIRALAN